MSVAQPTGTVTLLFTDVEGSTKLLDRLGAERYAETLELHRSALRAAFEEYGGYEFGTEGDAFFVAFVRAEDAVAAAAAVQQALAAAQWPDSADVRVRIGIHTGEPLPVDSNYVGMDLHRVARIMSAGHGGQVVVSEATAALAGGAPLRDLGPHRLKDMLEPIRLYQLEIDGLPDEFPPLRSLHRTNLPVAAWPLLGRERELGEIRTLLSEGARLLTLTGPGGSGKTRLALQAAAELSDDYADGTFFVALAPLRDLSSVLGTVAEAVGLQPDDDVVAWLAARRVLVVIDNLEHLPGVDAVIAQLLVGETVVIATSRTPLRLAAERELPVEPLPEDAAVELFVSRAAAAGRQVEADETVAEVCRRLDNLPLALELAAARSKLLSPSALLQRLDAALPILTGGAGDRPERQRTLRATIEWSHDLLDADVQAVFRRLSVFRGSFTLDAAEAITGADLDQVATLLDQSLLKPLGDDRFFLLETIREYAREQLEQAGETGDYASRHARSFLALLEEIEPARADQYFAWCAVEEDNLRAMLDRLIADRPGDAARSACLLSRFWFQRAAYSEARTQLRLVLSTPGLPEIPRAMVLTQLTLVETFLDDLEAAEDAGEQAIAAAETTGRQDLIAEALHQVAWVRARSGRNDDALEFMRQAADIAISLDDRTRLWTMFDLGSLLGEARLGDEARPVFKQTLEGAPTIGDPFLVIASLVQVAFIDLHERRFREARNGFASAIEKNREIGHKNAAMWARWGLGYALLGLGQRHEAVTTFAEAVELVLAAPQIVESHFSIIASGIAAAVESEQADSAARLRGAIAKMRAKRGWHEDPRNTDIEEFFDKPLIDALGREIWDREQASGATMTLEETIELARSLAGKQPVKRR